MAFSIHRNDGCTVLIFENMTFKHSYGCWYVHSCDGTVGFIVDSLWETFVPEMMILTYPELSWTYNKIG